MLFNIILQIIFLLIKESIKKLDGILFVDIFVIKLILEN
jgi:hypothetical protein